MRNVCEYNCKIYIHNNGQLENRKHFFLKMVDYKVNKRITAFEVVLLCDPTEGELSFRFQIGLSQPRWKNNLVMLYCLKMEDASKQSHPDWTNTTPKHVLNVFQRDAYVMKVLIQIASLGFGPGVCSTCCQNWWTCLSTCMCCLSAIILPDRHKH